MDIDLIKTAQAHLRLLGQANIPSIDEHTLRVASAPLRFLLVDGNLIQAWRALGLGSPIHMEAYCLASPPPIDAIGYCGGGDMLPGVPVSMGWGEVNLHVKTLKLHAFLEEPCISVKGQRITRRELVQYIANTKGGAHYDPHGRSLKSRSTKFALLRELEQDGFAGLGIKVNDRNLVHHELYSIIQSLLRSPEVQRLQAAIFP